MYFHPREWTWQDAGFDSRSSCALRPQTPRRKIAGGDRFPLLGGRFPFGAEDAQVDPRGFFPGMGSYLLGEGALPPPKVDGDHQGMPGPLDEFVKGCMRLRGAGGGGRGGSFRILFNARMKRARIRAALGKLLLPPSSFPRGSHK